jgi:DNA polymerase-1
MALKTGSKTLYLVDGTSQLFRAFFALPPLTNAEGLPTNAIYGFTTMLRKLIHDEQPEHLAVAFDLPGGTFRHDRYAEYKANRPPAPEDLNRQAPYAREVCHAFRIPVLELAGYEADDLIATYARLARAEGYDVVVVSSDKDLLQLVGERVTVLNPVKNTVLDSSETEKTFGVPPERVIDVLGLMGDSVDNIPGVPGVGAKTALAMVQTYGDVEAILARAGRFVAAWKARDAFLETLGVVEKQKPLEKGTAEQLEAAARELASALPELQGHEADDDFRSRLETVAGLLEAAPLDGLAERAGEGGRAVARDLKELKRELKALDRGSAKRVWHSVHEHEELARLSRELATLDHEAPVDFDPRTVTLGPPDRDRARELFEKLGFKALLPGLDEGEAAPAAKQAVPDAPATDHRTVLDRESLEQLADAIRAAAGCSIAAETGGDDPLRAALLGIAVAWGSGEAAYIPLGHEGLGAPDQVGVDEVVATLGPVLADPAMGKVAYDLKRHLKVLARHGFEIAGWGVDPKVAAFLLDPGHADLEIAALAREYLGREIGDAPVTPEVAAGDRTAVEQVGPHAAGRAEVTLRLAETLGSRLEEANLAELYRTIDGPLLPVLARMELAGIRVEREMLGEMSREMEAALDRLRGEIHDLAGVEFNVDSPKQLREVLFERLGLEPKRKTAKSRVSSTDARTLEELGAEHPIARRILDYRELAKLKGTYVDSLPQLIDPETGRVHTTYHPTGAATGRLSSSDPNLQNIPARTEAGLRIRSAFVPDPGSRFLASDYSQVELRILAHLSGDPELLEAFGRGDDIHRHTASLVYGVAPDLVSDAMRRRAKAVNFGIVYGMSQHRLAAEQGMSRGEARKFIEAYFERFEGIKAYIERIRDEARQDGFVRTLFGRVRYFPQLHQKVNRAVQEQAMRAAVNTTVQGTAADIMKMAMLRVEDLLDDAGLGARMLLQVHDELLFEVPEAEVEATAALVRRAMEGVCSLEVPLVVDQKQGASWSAVT